MAISTSMMAITTISSIMVNPRLPATVKRRCENRREKKFIRPRKFLPVGIFRAVERHGARKRKHVEHVFSAPTAGTRIVLYRAHPPLGVTGHRVHRDASQESHVLDRVASAARECVRPAGIGGIAS